MMHVSLEVDMTNHSRVMMTTIFHGLVPIFTFLGVKKVKFKFYGFQKGTSLARKTCDEVFCVGFVKRCDL